MSRSHIKTLQIYQKQQKHNYFCLVSGIHHQYALLPPDINILGGYEEQWKVSSLWIWDQVICSALGSEWIKSLSCPTLCNPMDCKPTRLFCPWNAPYKNTGVGYIAFLHGIFPIQQSNPGFPHCRQILYHWSYPGSSVHHKAPLTCCLVLFSLSSRQTPFLQNNLCIIPTQQNFYSSTPVGIKIV